MFPRSEARLTGGTILLSIASALPCVRDDVDGHDGFRHVELVHLHHDRSEHSCEHSCLIDPGRKSGEGRRLPKFWKIGSRLYRFRFLQQRFVSVQFPVFSRSTRFAYICTAHLCIAPTSKLEFCVNDISIFFQNFGEFSGFCEK